jgi:hypothetical protein
MSYGMPSDKVCAKLAKRDYEICRIPEGGGVKKTELKDVGDPEKLKIKDIKEVLSDNGVKCADCTEKADYVRKLKELLVSKGIKTEL